MELSKKRHWSVRIIEGIAFIVLILILYYTLIKERETKEYPGFRESQFSSELAYADSLLKAADLLESEDRYNAAKETAGKAVGIYTEVLEEVSSTLEDASPGIDPVHYSYLKHMEGLYSYKLYKAGDREHKELLNKAIISMKEALQFIDRDTNPVNYVKINFDLGIARSMGRKAFESIPYYKEALKYANKEEDPVKYADIQFRTGLAIYWHPQGIYEEAIPHYEEALKVYTPDIYPIKHAETIFELCKIFYKPASNALRDQNIPEKDRIRFVEYFT